MHFRLSRTPLPVLSPRVPRAQCSSQALIWSKASVKLSLVFLIRSVVFFLFRQIRWVRPDESLVTGFNVQLLLLWRATGSVSTCNLSAFDVIGSKAREIAGDDIVTIGNEECCPWQHCSFEFKTAPPMLRQPYSTDSWSKSYLLRQLLNLLAPSYLSQTAGV